MTENEQWEWTRLRERLQAVEADVKALATQAKETRAIMQALEDRVHIDGAALVAKMAGDGELDWLNSTRPESAKKAKR